MSNNQVPFKCYFCNRKIENESQQNHVSTCGSVLEPCPNKCGSYISRDSRGRHLQVCQNRVHRRSWTDSGEFNGHAMNHTLRKISESSMNLHAPGPSVLALDRNVKDLSLKLSELNGRNHRIFQEHKNEMLLANTAINKLTVQTQNLAEWRNYLQFQIEQFTRELKSCDAIRKDTDIALSKLNEHTKDLSNLSMALNAHKVSFKDEQIRTRENLNEITGNLQVVRDTFVQENAVVAALWNDQKQQIARITEERKEFDKQLDELREKLNNITFEVRTSNELIADCHELIKKQDGEVNAMRNAMAETKLSVEMAEDNFSNVQGLVCTSSGRIMWKISDFTLKLEQAKKQEKVPLRGPIFYTQDYGYKIRLLVYLNGLKKWKGRYLLACLHVIKGDYDALLQWPCRVEANVILKDCENYDKPKDYARYITAKRDGPNDEAEEPQESSTQYIFISHKTLMESRHMKDDTFYLEIVTNQQRPKEETHI